MGSTAALPAVPLHPVVVWANGSALLSQSGSDVTLGGSTAQVWALWTVSVQASKHWPVSLGLTDMLLSHRGSAAGCELGIRQAHTPSIAHVIQA